jgi:hypothetical protein
VRAELWRGHDHATLTIGLTDDRLVLRGRAVWSDGRPFRGRVGATGFEDRAMNAGEWSAVIHVAPAVETAADGTFTLTGLPRALLRPTALLPGRVRFVGPPILLPIDSEILFVVDQGWRYVPGRVLEDGTESPVQGAVVTRKVWGNGIHDLVFRAETDATGRFGTWVSPEHAVVSVEHPGFAGASGRLRDGEDEIVVRLRRLGRIHGRVVTYEGRRPVAGAVVRIAWGSTAVSDAEGNYVVDDVPPGDRLVYVQGGGWNSTLLVNGGERPLEPLIVKVESGAEIERDLTVVASARAKVKVLDEAGAPVTDARVRLRWHPRGKLMGQVHRTEYPLVGRTGRDGSCLFENLVPGVSYTPRARLSGRPDAWGKKFLATAAEPGESTIRLEPCGVRAVRLVFEDTKEPVACAVIAGYGFGTWVTDESGFAEIGPLAAGEFRIAVTHPDIAWSRDAIALPATSDPVTIELRRGCRLGGKVTWRDGRPAAGAVVLLRSENLRGSLFVPVSADGSFQFCRLPSAEACRLRAWIHESGKDLYSEEVQARLGDLDHVLVLRAPEPVQPKQAAETSPQFVLRVRGPDGEPVASGKAVLWLRQGKRSYPRTGTVRKGICRVPIDENSEVAFAELIFCRAGERRLGAWLEPMASTSTELKVRLEDGREISGKVVDRGGKPVIGAHVDAYHTQVALPRRTEFAHDTARTGEDGTFRLRGLGDLPYSIHVRPPKPWAPCERQLHAGQSDAVIFVETAIAPVISVLDYDGKPVGRAFLRIEPEGGGPLVVNPYRSQTGPDGKVRIEGLEPGKRYRLSFWLAENRTDLLPKTIEPWAPQYTEIRLDRAFEIRGLVRTETGETPSGQVAVYLRRKGAADWTWAWTRGGRFRFPMLSAGEYELKVGWTHGKEDDGSLPVITVEAGAQTVELTLKGSR